MTLQVKLFHFIFLGATAAVFHLQVFYYLSTWRAPPSLPPSFVLPSRLSLVHATGKIVESSVKLAVSEERERATQRRRLSGNQHGSGICQGFVPHFKEVDTCVQPAHI